MVEIDYSLAILFIADTCYTEVLMANDKRKIVSLPIGQIEKKLPGIQFFRCHKKYIVNREYIVSVDAVEKQIVLSNNRIIPISHRKLPEFVNWFIL